MKLLVWTEHDNATMHDATAAAITAAASLGTVTALVAGHGCGRVAGEVAGIEGVAEVLLADDPAYAHMLAENASSLILSLMPGFDGFVAASTTTGRNIAPRVAALLDVMQVSDVIAIEGPRTFRRPIYAGNAIATVTSSDAKLVLTIRGTAFARAGAGSSAAPVRAVAGAGDAALSQFVAAELSQSDRPDLSSAKVVVSGGRALKDAARFREIIHPLADRVGAAVGASRAAVDAGYVPSDCQVGQTGKVVAPDVYVAIGISGAIQHLAGMKDSKVIIAINSDEDAPIFQVSDYGLVGDLFEVVPQLVERL